MSRKEGYLLKCANHSYRGFQRRYFVLEDGRLECVCVCVPCVCVCV